MVQTINPAVSGERESWVIGAVIFVAATALGAMTSAMLVMGVIAALAIVGPFGPLVLAVAAVVLVILRDLGVPVVVPYRSRQVPEHWRHEGRLSIVSASYGALLGFGFTTPFVSAAHLAALTAIPFGDSLLMLILVSSLYAIGRASVLLAGTGVPSLEELSNRLAGKETRNVQRRWIRRMIGVSSAALVLLAILSRVSELGSGATP